MGVLIVTLSVITLASWTTHHLELLLVRYFYLCQVLLLHCGTLTGRRERIDFAVTATKYDRRFKVKESTAE